MKRAFYSINEILEMTGLGRTKIYEEINRGALKAYKCGNRTLVSAETFEQWKSALTNYSVN
tara:strand:+ start:1095 stop:1277 length:183 start_codon:yes stop_codon:yes gene_type:complete